MDNFKGKNAIPQEEFSFAQSVIAKLGDYFSNRVVGQEELKKSLITAVVADGHILIESVPGLAKTTAAKAISDAVSGKFSRIQCTPDLLPSDIIGTQIYHQETGKFETIFGPVFANFVLLDEVNRSSAKTQSAMLEAMQERQVTIGGITYKMPQDIFIVIATQNPIETGGTFPLPEAQMDRFLMKLSIGLPDEENECRIMERSLKRIVSGGWENDISAVADAQTIALARREASQVQVSEDLIRYIADLVKTTRERPDVEAGVSPRGTLALLHASQSLAFLEGRAYVVPEDITRLAVPVCAHRLVLTRHIGRTAGQRVVMEDIVRTVPVPTEQFS